ncbi:MAG: cyclopropane fatty acyl phospholipid synthase [Geobacteraceae bacterium]|nr:cyclopropane fatty acyl phospholipid synthase [Geobacteraceae bacterium]
MSYFQRRIEKLFDQAGIVVNGPSPWDITVHNRDLFRRLLAHGSLGLGEAYMDGWWDCERIDQLVCRLFIAGIDRRVKTPELLLAVLRARFMNRQSHGRAFEVGRRHYDIGHDLYVSMLDSRLIYSCGCWQDANSLDEAQERKLELICRKLRLEKGMRLLDIGCGWGGLARYAAERYGVNVVGITVSDDQVRFACEKCAGLPVEIRLEDYRNVSGVFDRIVSVGMLEHVGYKNYRTFMAVVDRCLNREGLFLLQTIGGNTSVTTTDPWIERYIFPNGMLPSAVQIASAAEGLFMLEDWQNFGFNYDRTLMAWWRRFEDSWPGLAARYGERFHRMWRYYLLSCAGAFRARANQLWQIVFSKSGYAVCYQSDR